MTTITMQNKTKEEIKIQIIQAILSYKQHAITLKKLVQIVREIRKDNYDALPYKFKDVIDDICSLLVVEDVITDMLFELKKWK